MIYVISTYPPKACGIAVFSWNFVDSLRKNLIKKEQIGVIAMVDKKDNIDEYGKEVIFKIDKNDHKEYIHAADFININKPRVCVIEHEFGIFGGEDGYFVLSLLNRIQVDTVVVFHTILQNPDDHQLLVIKELSKRCKKVVVMSEFGVNYLIKIYGLNKNKISYIPHGVPHVGLISKKKATEKPNRFPGKLLVTFGLLSRNKGLETAILAMREIIKKNPETQYLIIGKTHPEVIKHSGEEYRNFLISLVEKNNLQKNVLFINSFLSEEQIIEYVQLADIYVTPYQNPNQITSGTLSYAIGSGIPFVSTPYRYAEEKSQEGCGRLFPFKEHCKMAKVVCDLFAHPEELKKMKQKCQQLKKTMSWQNVGSEYLSLFKKLGDKGKPQKDEGYKINLSWLPTLNLSHVYLLTDRTGIIQHAHYSIPRFSDGYCVDDNSRAMILMLMAYRINKDTAYREKLSTYLAFIDYMLNSDGSIRNFLSFDRHFLDKTGSADCYGRTLWALGYLIAFPPTEYFRDIGKELFLKMTNYLPSLISQNSLRGIANAIIGVSYFLSASLKKNKKSNEEINKEMKKHIRQMADLLLQTYHRSCHDNWEWFEDTMTYDNALMPLALLRAYEFLGEKEYLQVGLSSMHFLGKAMTKGDFYQPVGNNNWYHKEHDNPSEYDQQPIEIMSLTWLYYHAFRVTKDVQYIKNIRQAFRWFLGDNALGLSLYDYETKGCCDGLQKGKLNRNQGAESTLSFWISYCLVFFAVELEHEYLK